MTSKLSALIAGGSSALLGFAAYIADMPPDTQAGISGVLTNLFPAQSRGTVGAVLKALAMLCMYTSIHYAAKSGAPTSTSPASVQPTETKPPMA